ncbi:Leucine-rich repeat neuronal protein 3-like [Aphelenchoides fujianensis]|nr:Leucine-rich repeat neuronal protein 3-like [Aphelenchoides fujianensis]
MAAGRALFLFFLLLVSIECRVWNEDEWIASNTKHTSCRCHRSAEFSRLASSGQVLNCSNIWGPSDRPTMREVAEKLHELPDCIRGEATLDFSNNGLVDFDLDGIVNVSQWSFIRKLDLSGNNLYSLDRETMDLFPRLEVLQLDHNKFGAYDFATWPLKGNLTRSLTELHLGYNSLSTLPFDSFKHLKKLKKLVLDGNPRFVNSSFFGIPEFPPSLKELSLEGCELRGLDHLPLNVQNVESLSLARNKLRYIPSIFHNFSRPRSLDLSGNPLERINFVLPQLVELKMRQMPRLYSIENNAFSAFSNLRVLDLSGSSELSTIHPNAFGFESSSSWNKALSLRVLNVENCGLMKLNSTTIPLSQLEELRLGGNPWICDPSMEWLFRAWSTRRWTVGRNLTCDYPLSLRGVEPWKAYETPIPYTPAYWQRDSRTTDRWDRWATTRQPRFPFWFAESTRSPYTDELGGEVDEWWARDVMPALRSAPHHPAVYFAAGAIASAVVLLAGWCCCQAVGCCFRRCCCPKPRSSWGVRNEAADDRRLIADDDTKTEVDTISNI